MERFSSDPKGLLLFAELLDVPAASEHEDRMAAFDRTLTVADALAANL